MASRTSPSTHPSARAVPPGAHCSACPSMRGSERSVPPPPGSVHAAGHSSASSSGGAVYLHAGARTRHVHPIRAALTQQPRVVTVAAAAPVTCARTSTGTAGHRAATAPEHVAWCEAGSGSGYGRRWWQHRLDEAPPQRQRRVKAAAAARCEVIVAAGACWAALAAIAGAASLHLLLSSLPWREASVEAQHPLLRRRVVPPRRAAAPIGSRWV
jgi:hypothetical protein